jgi:hypothetical protein
VASNNKLSLFHLLFKSISLKIHVKTVKRDLESRFTDGKKEAAMRIRLMTLALAFVPPTAASAADTGSIKGHWSFTAHAGVDIDVAGKVHDSGTGTVLGLTTSVMEKAFREIYNTPVRWRLEMGYGVSDRVELLADLLYSKVSSKIVKVGDVAGFDLNAEFADYREVGWSLGARYFLNDSGSLRPNVTVWATMSQLDKIPSTFSVPDALVTLPDTDFYDKTVIYGGGADLGVRYRLTKNLCIGASAGLRYQTKPKELEGLAGTGLENLNDVGWRVYAPIAVSTIVHF